MTLSVQKLKLFDPKEYGYLVGRNEPLNRCSSECLIGVQLRYFFGICGVGMRVDRGLWYIFLRVGHFFASFFRGFRVAIRVPSSWDMCVGVQSVRADIII